MAAVRRPGPGWQILVALGVAVAWWCLGQAFWIVSDSVEEVIFVARIQYTAIPLVPGLWFALACAHTGRSRWLRPTPAACWLLVPLITVILAWTYQHGHPNPLWRGFVMPPETLTPQALYGPWFWVFAIHNYALFLGGCLMMFVHYSQSPHYRMQLYATAIAPLLLLILNGLFITGHWPLSTDPTPLGFALGFAFLGWTLLRHRLFDVSPLGRGIAFDSLHEGVMILDAQQRVVDINAAACRFVARTAEQVLGCRIHELLPEFPATEVLEKDATLRMMIADSVRLQLNGASIRDSAGSTAGMVVILRDVTEEHRAEQELIATQQRLQEVNSELERIAHTDALTGLANRRLLLARLDEEFARARRNGAPLALMMIDLDHFKRVNDTHGHLTGDGVLSVTGTMLRSLKRPADVAARYGGEELSLLLTDVDDAGARAAACRVWKSLREVIHKGPSAQEFRVTSSVGLALLRESDAIASDLIARADAALYVAKSAGRDRVLLAVDSGFETLTEIEP